jgi:hypothetical protein
VLAPAAMQLLQKAQVLADALAPYHSAIAALSFEPMRKIGAWMPEEVKPLVAAKEAAVAFVEAAGHIERSDVWRNARQILRTDPTAALSELDALLSDKPAG